MKKKKIIDKKKSKTGSLDKYLIKEVGWVSKERAIELTIDNELDAVVVYKNNKAHHIRSKPNQTKTDNFSILAKDSGDVDIQVNDRAINNYYSYKKIINLTKEIINLTKEDPFQSAEIFFLGFLIININLNTEN